MDSQQYARPPKVVHSCSANFVRVQDELKEPPMLLTAWTQTTGEDFDLLRTVDSEMQAENRALREKLRYVESKLQQQSDLLSQIHATSARMQLGTAPAQSTHTSPPTPPAHQQHQILTPPSSVICAPVVPAGASQRTEVIDYKIISADGSDADAIEIRLAAESLNSLSSSADSDRLEICLHDEQQSALHGVKQEPSQGSDKTPLQFIKRRKLDVPELTNSPNTGSPLQEQQNIYRLPARKSIGKTPKTKVEVAGDAKGQHRDNVMVSIGPNNTCVPASVFENINWNSSSLATRKLLVAIFDRETLATHSMTGKPSPAFKEQQKPLKQMLDPLKIQDIIFAVTRKCSASEREVRNAITTKCADENKMMKIQNGKRRSHVMDLDKENIV
ncbi:protein insensitive [Scaptodrosophila lebanonensis]|uniref:Protein insensitive n=1 Tax=Drosophila lebanonensis TaxID=7225 RepID=A0A6J2U568_DROLE|nr:protein insensitive [Scaptodrosophila lebanonensis]XP_030383090.1 protein insensitive [Scaptodrosophila lebanonensis]